MTQNAKDENGLTALSPEDARYDPQLVNICELGRLMSLSPKELIARINLGGAPTRLGEPLPPDDGANDPPRGAPTGAALTSLASIVSALQRDPLPALEPAPAALPLARPPPTAHEEPEPHLDDEPMFVPSTWLQPASNTEDRWVLQQMRPVALGVIAALALVVPTLLWLGGWLGTSRKPNVGEPVPAAAAVKPAPTRAIEAPEQPMGEPERADQHDTPSVQRSSAAEAPDKPAVKAAEPESTSEKVVQEAMRRIANEDVTGARDLLAAAGNDPQGLVPFALAETYDPNMLAAWGTRGIAPDAAKAKALYAEALDLGNARARQRIDALQ